MKQGDKVKAEIKKVLEAGWLHNLTYVAPFKDGHVCYYESENTYSYWENVKLDKDYWEDLKSGDFVEIIYREEAHTCHVYLDYDSQKLRMTSMTVSGHTWPDLSILYGMAPSSSFKLIKIVENPYV